MQPRLILPNPNYPLPPDYGDLSTSGRRLARVNAARQWFLAREDVEKLCAAKYTAPFFDYLGQAHPSWSDASPAQRSAIVEMEYGELMVASTWFFDNWYLQPDWENDFSPMFYDMDPMPTPDFHWNLSRFWATNRMNIAIAPRGSAKSTHCRRDMVTRICSHPGYSFVYATSTHDNAKQTAEVLRHQAYNNPRVQEDFGHEFGGSLRPSRGEAPTGTEFFKMRNGAYVRCVSAESRQRGQRPRRYRLDDPEFDSKASTSMESVRDYMETLIFKVAMPMVMRRNCGIDWVATFVSQRHFAYYAMSTVKGPDGKEYAEDRRFDYWGRMLIPAAYESEENGKLVSCWPEMWPVDEEERDRLGLQGAPTLGEIRRTIGTAHFNNEYMGKPSGESTFFTLDNRHDGNNAWWIENVDDIWTTDPGRSATKICYRDPTTQEVIKTEAREFLPQIKLFITVDSAFTEKATSDRRVACLMGIQRGTNCLFVLDMWSDKSTDSVLTNETFRIAERWKCPIIFVETVRETYKLFRRFQHLVKTRLTEQMGVGHVPAVKDLKPGSMSKVDKISALDVRIEHGLLKLPISQRHRRPWWQRLISQFEDFHPEMPDGGLGNDDEIDSVSMSLMCINGRYKRLIHGEKDQLGGDIKSRIMAGHRTYPGTSIRYSHALDISKMDAELVAKLMYEEEAKGARSKV